MKFQNLVEKLAKALTDSKSSNEEIRQSGLSAYDEVLGDAKENGTNFQMLMTSANALNGNNTKRNNRKAPSKFGSNYRH